MSSVNQFEYYSQIRQRQLHSMKIMNPQVKVPSHTAFKPVRAKIQQARSLQRMKEQKHIDNQNVHIMQKLVNINHRKLKSNSTPLLPPIQRKKFKIPQHDRENNVIAAKLINSKPHIKMEEQLNRYKTYQMRRQSLSKYDNSDGVVINRKKYIAELMFLKKMRLSDQVSSRVYQSSRVYSNTSRVTNKQRYNSRQLQSSKISLKANSHLSTSPSRPQISAARTWEQNIVVQQESED